MHESTSAGHFNPDAESPITSIEELRQALRQTRSQGDAFLDWLLTGDFFAGKGVWVNPDIDIRRIYQNVLDARPELETDSPWHPGFRTDGVRDRGDNPVVLTHIRRATDEQRERIAAHHQDVASGEKLPVALMSGGPAAKIAAVLSTLANAEALDTRFVIDRAVQSNESGSASYEHINHANALNAEFDNSGLAILRSALRRVLLGEPDPAVALDTDYRRVDLWPRGLRLRDIPVFAQYEWQGLYQRLKKWIGQWNDHDLSRLASQRSTRILSFVEQSVGVPLRVESQGNRAFFLALNEHQHRHAQSEKAHLRKRMELQVQELSAEELAHYYGPSAPQRITSGDRYPENSCFRHGFDAVVKGILEDIGGTYKEGWRISRIFFDRDAVSRPRAVAVLLEHIGTGEPQFQPVDHLGVSLGPTATYEWDTDIATGHITRIADRLKFGQPVPHQTIATGATIQVLFRITDKNRFSELPFTGLKQTHFVEMGGDGDFLLVKLTSGGNIGHPLYSRSYAISALAGLLRVVTPDCGLEYVDTVCIWPCIRGVNGPNDGQLVRLADNAVVRFGEGGTGMSKMGSNAQTLLDMVGIHHGLPEAAEMALDIYRHTIIDRRLKLQRRLGL